MVVGGWYGGINVGDELLLEQFVRWIHECGAIPVVISADPAYTSKMLGVHAIDRRNLADVIESLAGAALFVLGGGGLFQDYDTFNRQSMASYPSLDASQFAQYFFAARALGVATAVLAQGVGPLRADDARGIVAEIFATATFASVRDQDSADLLRSLGVERTLSVAPDPVWSLPLPARIDLVERAPHLSGLRVLGINVRNWPFDGDWEPAFVAVMRSVALPGWGCLWVDFNYALAEDGARLVSIDNSPRLVPQIAEGVHAHFHARSPQDAVAALISCDAVLAMRMHAGLVAHQSLLPVASLEYDAKVRTLDEALGVPAAQRVQLDKLPSQLPNALRRLTGNAPPPFTLSAAQRDRLASGAQSHREVLTRALGARTAPAYDRTATDRDRKLISSWLADRPLDAPRIARAFANRGQDATPSWAGRVGGA